MATFSRWSINSKNMNYYLKGKRSAVKERRNFRIKETRVKLFSFLKKMSSATLTLPNISNDFLLIEPPFFHGHIF